MADLHKVAEAEKVIVQYIYGRGDQLTSNDISETVRKFQPIFDLDQEDMDYLIKLLESQYVTTMGVGVSLIDQNIPHDEDWFGKREIEWGYWSDYETYLIHQGWPNRVVSSMNSVTDKILGLLKDPLADGEWERRGLVIGHVQSGKTANYIGLITKAADAGYKFIIVIAGIHNNLRTQTQERVDEGFIGRDSRTNQLIGVGLLGRYARAMPVTVTTTDSDFNKSLARRFGMQLRSLNNTFILVIKKNTSTLGSLYTWLKELNTHQEREKITDIPMLLIDDEADNASINVNGPDELDPSKINGEIRRILNLFRKRCYVGYTATPFANIFIDPDDKNEMLGNDLFPEHFIYSLDVPTNYFGAEKIFLDEGSSDKFFREIADAEEWIPLSHRKDDPINGLPPTLKKAILTFILSRAIRNNRGQSKEHCSMLINVSRFVASQREVKQLTEAYINELKKAVRYNYKLPEHTAYEDRFIAELYKVFVEEYDKAGTDWSSVLAELNNAASAIKVFLVNSKSDDALDYKAYAKDDNALTAIVIGGLSLSRGLTIEGLTVSYIYRNSIMYDTLMQMGRWFGYRNNYEDLCRIYMSDISRGWYTHVAEATEELRMQVKRMRRDGKKPSDFGLYVRAHPDTLIVTAANKMRHADNRALQVSYDGKLLETHIIPDSPYKTERNGELFKAFYAELLESFAPYTDSTTRSYLFRDIPWERILDFVLKFSFHEAMFDLKENVPEFIKVVSDIYPVWDVVFQSVSGAPPPDGYMIATQMRTIGYASENPRKPSPESGWHVGNKNRFSGNSMFKIGLDPLQEREAEKEAGKRSPIYSEYTNARGKPVLMLHILKLVEKEPTEIVMPIAPAISISFPNSNSDELKTVNYIVNPVWLRQFEETDKDSPNDEDDRDL